MSEGYLHPLYAKSFAYLGEPLFLPNSKGWLIKRKIPGTLSFDAMGPYPLFFCKYWDALISDLESLRDELVSVSLVIGPFVDFPRHKFQTYFDILTPYKVHYYLDLSRPLEETIGKSHRKSAMKALRNLRVDLVQSPNINLEEWVYLYDHLVKRHNIKGVRAFPRECFAKQIAIPNTLFFRAWLNEELVGGNLYYIQENTAYAHLLALTDEGYRIGASHALKWVSFNYLAAFVEKVNLGGSTDNFNNAQNGLVKFKSGWSNLNGVSNFCTKILDRDRYTELVAATNSDDSQWFPAYRSGDYS